MAPVVEEAEIKNQLWTPRIHRIIDTIASIFWLYAIIKLFIFDVDLWIASLFPSSLMILLQYRLLIFLFVICVVVLLTRRLYIALTALYILVFPLVVAFWKVPRALWQNGSWLLAFSVMNTVVALVSSFKRNLLLFTIFLIASTIVLAVDHQLALYVTLLSLIGVLSCAYVYSMIKAFKPSAIFEAYKKIFSTVRASDFLKVDTAVTLLPATQMTGEQLTLTTNSLQNIVLYNRGCLFLARRLRDYQKSRLNTLSHIVGLLFLLIFTATTFAFVNYGIFKIDETSFRSDSGVPSFFTFFYYSVGCIFYATNAVVPDTVVAQSAQILQFFFSVLLLVILAAILFAMRGEKYNAELNVVIRSAEQEGRHADSMITSSFNVGNVTAAIEALQAAKAGLVGVIVAATRSLDEPD